LSWAINSGTNGNQQWHKLFFSPPPSAFSRGSCDEVGRVFEELGQDIIGRSISAHESRRSCGDGSFFGDVRPIEPMEKIPIQCFLEEIRGV
jgi:hypothetical protein